MHIRARIILAQWSSEWHQKQWGATDSETLGVEAQSQEVQVARKVIPITMENQYEVQIIKKKIKHV
jgi:hypothetical protein